MRNWSYALILSIGITACGQQQKDAPSAFVVDTPVAKLREKSDSTMGAKPPWVDQRPKIQIDTPLLIGRGQRNPIHPENSSGFGDKGFDERYRAALDSFFSNPAKEIRENDSLLAIARRKSAARDSLRKLKQGDQ